MPANFYSGREADLASGATNLIATVSMDPERYGVTPERLAAFTEIANAFVEPWKKSIQPSTNTTVVVAEKRAAKKVLKAQCYLMGCTISGTETVSDADLVALRLNGRDKRNRRPTPSEAPSMYVESVDGRRVNLRICQPNCESRRRKPIGVLGAQIFAFVGEQPATDPSQFTYIKLASRAKTTIVFPDNIKSGSTVWLSAVWLTARGKTSSASAAVPFTLTGGPVTPRGHAEVLRRAA